MRIGIVAHVLAERSNPPRRTVSNNREGGLLIVCPATFGLNAEIARTLIIGEDDQIPRSLGQPAMNGVGGAESRGKGWVQSVGFRQGDEFNVPICGIGRLPELKCLVDAEGLPAVSLRVEDRHLVAVFGKPLRQARGSRSDTAVFERPKHLSGYKTDTQLPPQELSVASYKTFA